jgi:hypothetical protein
VIRIVSIIVKIKLFCQYWYYKISGKISGLKLDLNILLPNSVYTGGLRYVSVLIKNIHIYLAFKTFQKYTYALARGGQLFWLGGHFVEAEVCGGPQLLK